MEKVFFEYGDVKVTNTRFISGANTYAMAGITSIKLSHQKPSYFDVVLDAILAIGGLGFALISIKDGDTEAILAGLASCAFFGGAGYFMYKKKKTLYLIMLSTAGGESEGLRSDQLEYASQVTKALNEAIIYRD
jgi:hypothetical protein